MSEFALKIICENGDYFFSEEGTYIRMYEGTRAQSLLPRYATDYIVHKEAVRQLFLDGFRNFIFDTKKAFFPPIPLCIGGSKFSKVKSTLDFVKNLENFHFGEKSFHMNDFKARLLHTLHW